jgi:hypothetical protein
MQLVEQLSSRPLRRTLMAVDTWNAMAADMIKWVRANLDSPTREAVAFTHQREAVEVVAVFGGGNAGSLERARRELEELRQTLRNTAIQELGSALGPDDDVWVMVVDSRNRLNELSSYLRSWLAEPSSPDAHAAPKKERMVVGSRSRLSELSSFLRSWLAQPSHPNSNASPNKDHTEKDASARITS